MKIERNDEVIIDTKDRKLDILIDEDICTLSYFDRQNGDWYTVYFDEPEFAGVKEHVKSKIDSMVMQNLVFSAQLQAVVETFLREGKTKEEILAYFCSCRHGALNDVETATDIVNDIIIDSVMELGR